MTFQTFDQIYDKTSQELRMLSTVTLNCQVTKIVTNSDSQLSKLSKCLKLSRIVRIVKNSQKRQQNCQNCQNYEKGCQICQKLSKKFKLSIILKIVKIFVRSCFLITVIKCLKGQWSLGSLFNVKTSQELRMLSSVTINCQVRMIV